MSDRVKTLSTPKVFEYNCSTWKKLLDKGYEKREPSLLKISVAKIRKEDENALANLYTSLFASRNTLHVGDDSRIGSVWCPAV
jgi:hypothetical protein